jgi:hypothetical protein
VEGNRGVKVVFALLQNSLSGSAPEAVEPPNHQDVARPEVVEGLLKSLFGKVHTPPTSRLSIRRIVATSMRVSLVCTIRS